VAKKKKKKKNRLRSWDEIRAETPVDERDVEAIERLMDAEGSCTSSGKAGTPG
jgi:hypothetical protein